MPANRSRRINVLGFLKADRPLKSDSLTSYIVEESVDSEVVIAVFDDMAEKVEQETWVILDNAPQHTSKAFKGKIKSWEDKGLHLEYLPPYSPELNSIEILWRLIKYQWLGNGVFGTIKCLRNALDEILVSVGVKHMINYG